MAGNLTVHIADDLQFILNYSFQYSPCSHTQHVIGYLLQGLSQDYDHITYVVGVNLLHEWRDLQFTVDSEQKIFDKILTTVFIYSQSVCRKSSFFLDEEIFYFHTSFSWRYLSWGLR